MSQVYSTEPQTTGRVILNTTHGPIDIHLFCKEAPTTCRTFLQLCLDGFYDNLIFHRILCDFMIQTGQRNTANANTNASGKAKKIQDGYNKEILPPIDVPKKKLEVIPRIKFNHRGQVALALPLDDDASSSASHEEMDELQKQIFISLDEAPFLDKKYIIFGTIRGDTIYNALRIGKAETVGDTGELADKDNAPKVKDVRIVEHIFDDLVATKEDLVPWKVTHVGDGEDGTKGNGDSLMKRKKKRKGKRDLNVLSFGGEMEDVDEGLDRGSGGMKSSHDLAVLGASREIHIDGDDDDDNDIEQGNGKRKKKKMRIRSTATADTDDYADERGDGKEEDDDASNNNNVFNTRKEDTDIEGATGTGALDEAKLNSQASSQGPSIIYQRKFAPSKTTGQDSQIVKDQPPAKAPAAPRMSALEARRMKYLKPGTSSRGGLNISSKQRDDDTLSKLNQFKSKMFEVKGLQDEGAKADGSNGQDNSLAARMVRKLAAEEEKERKVESKPTYSGQILEDDEHGDEDGGSNWLSTKFKCGRHIDHDAKDQALGGDGRKMDDYEVVDDKRRDPKHSKGVSRERNGRQHRDDKRWR
jgi:cyclophilin family peptidyl-prolyl cis-trans isomerase